MNKTQKLKSIILDNYKSINKFAEVCDIPTSTLRSALDNDIGGMAVDRVIKICDILNIDVKTFEPIVEFTTRNTISISENKLLHSFNKLNDLGKNEAIKRVDELTYINKYTEIESNQRCLSYLSPVAAHDDNLTVEEKNRMDEIITKKLKDLGKL
ncbi:MAG: XRE family transcriptional regulator [Clostridium sp.]|uniref:XRE family transcriptional regulator n=1 Tax=Clostridium sp. TaxID=1506 RepID=UPI003F320AB3